MASANEYYWGVVLTIFAIPFVFAFILFVCWIISVTEKKDENEEENKPEPPKPGKFMQLVNDVADIPTTDILINGYAVAKAAKLPYDIAKESATKSRKL